MVAMGVMEFPQLSSRPVWSVWKAKILRVGELAAAAEAREREACCNQADSYSFGFSVRSTLDFLAFICMMHKSYAARQTWSVRNWSGQSRRGPYLNCCTYSCIYDYIRVYIYI